MKTKLSIALCLTVLVLAACGVGTVPARTETAVPANSPSLDASAALLCDKLTSSMLPELNLVSIGTREEFLSWAKLQPGSNYGSIRLGESVDGSQSAYWTTESVRYALDFGQRGDRRLYVVWIDLAVPTVGQVLACFGEPQLYRAYNKSYVDGRRFTGEMWYLTRGWQLHLDQVLRGAKIQLDTKVSQAVIGRPGSTLMMAMDVFPNVKSLSEAKPIVDQLLPWPGKIEATQIEDYR